MLKKLITVALFVACVPGILFVFPPHSSHATVVLAHGIIFAILNYYVHKYVNTEGMGNFGDKCPPGFKMNEKEECVPIGF